MSSTYTSDELRTIAREQNGPEATKAEELLVARGEAPEDSFEERHGQTAMEARL
jgi:hypothetical protein